MTTVNAELVFNFVTKKLRNVPAAKNKNLNSGKTEQVPPLNIKISCQFMKKKRKRGREEEVKASLCLDIKFW